MKRSAIPGLLAGAVALAMAGAASADNIDSMAGNTSVCTAPDGAVTKVYVESGGNFTLTLPNGQVVHGTGKDDGSQICYTETDPPSSNPPVCVASVARKVGDTWTVEARGQSQSCTLAGGRQ